MPSDLIGQYYRAENPFPFMEGISIQGKTNFFERRVGMCLSCFAFAVGTGATIRFPSNEQYFV